MCIFLCKYLFQKLSYPFLYLLWENRPFGKNDTSAATLPGGHALPNLQFYYWTAVLVSVRWWFSQPKDNPVEIIEAALLGSYATLSNLLFWEPLSHTQVTCLMRITICVWSQSSLSYPFHFCASYSLMGWSFSSLPSHPAWFPTVGCKWGYHLETYYGKCDTDVV